MANSKPTPHFILLPLLGPGRHIPMVDIAVLLAGHGAAVTLVTTPLNAASFCKTLHHHSAIRTLILHFPGLEVGLPPDCESIETLPRDPDSAKAFHAAMALLRDPVEQYLLDETTQPRPSCIVSDERITWSSDTASKLGIPRLVFDGMSCFSLACSHHILVSKVSQSVSSDHDPFTVPGLPDPVRLTRAQLPIQFNSGSLKLDELFEKMKVAEESSFGRVVNSFEELEPKYVELCRGDGKKVYCVGPVSRRRSDQKSGAVGEAECLRWLDRWPEGSVVYVCLGTLSRLGVEQLVELGFGLEGSGRPFVWVVREPDRWEELKEVLGSEGFMERTSGRGLLIWGWAPQVQILSHPATGIFLTHCGWNSVLEGISAGVAMVTWPLLSEQFYNEKFVVEVLKVGESLGAEVAMRWGEEERYGVMVKRERIEKAIGRLLGDEREWRERRERAKKLSELAGKSVQDGGSSYLNVGKLIDDVMQRVGGK